MFAEDLSVFFSDFAVNLASQAAMYMGLVDDPLGPRVPVNLGAARQMLDILHRQQFRSGIPAGLPREARVANKTGDISTVAHDAGLVYLPERKP